MSFVVIRRIKLDLMSEGRSFRGSIGHVLGLRFSVSGDFHKTKEDNIWN
jgi:hypothetical protein